MYDFYTNEYNVEDKQKKKTLYDYSQWNLFSVC